MASKVRCTNCRGYFDRSEAFWQGNGGVSRICSEACYSEWRDKKPTKTVKKSNKRKPRAPGIPTSVRAVVRARDKACRWCRHTGTEVHHILYRSQGGPDDPSNLILLCGACHARAHSSKEAFQPILLACIWMHYVESSVMTVPEVASHLRSLRLLSPLQEERLG